MWQQEAGPTAFGAFERDTDYFGSPDAGPDDIGRFGWVTDPEGRRIELWQPA